MSSLNPHRDKLERLERRIEANRRERRLLMNEAKRIRAIQKRDLAPSIASLGEAELKASETKTQNADAAALAARRLAEAEKSLQDAEAQLRDLHTELDQLWPVIPILGRRKRERRQDLKSAITKAQILKREREREEAAARDNARNAKALASKSSRRLSDLRKEIALLREQLNEVNAFDEKAYRAQLQRLNQEFKRLEEKRAKLQDQEQALNERLAGLPGLLLEAESELAEVRRKANNARRLVRELGRASDDAGERRRIHEVARAELGDSSPERVLKTLDRAEAGLTRKIAKYKRRAREIVSMSNRAINAIVIDGNNLCYDRTGFIGDAPVRAVASALSKRCTVLVFFDGSIGKLLDLTPAQVRARYPEDVEVHVLTENASADALLLSAAAGRGSFVVSNDKFLEYPDQDAVRNERILRHFIANGRVIVEALGLNEPFRFERRQGAGAASSPTRS